MNKHKLRDNCILRRIVSLRGGGDDTKNDSSNNDPSNNDIIDNASQPIGIIDIRSQAECDCIILINRNEQKNTDVPFASHSSSAIAFPSFCNSNHIERSPEEMEQNQAAAAALTIGSSCPTIYLLLTYDFNNGKTVLHRTLGGVKLMNMVDGIRIRFKDFIHDSANEMSSCTKLILFLVPSKSRDDEVLSILNDCQSNQLFLDLTEDDTTSWKKEID